jgi:putative transposase
MREFFTAAEILAVGAAALPRDLRALNRLIDRERWHDDAVRVRAREQGRGGGAEYHLSLLPAEVQAKLIAAEAPVQAALDARSTTLWQRFERLPEKTKAVARARLAAVERTALLAAGMPRRAAVALVAREQNVATSSLWNWLRAAQAVHRADRLPALAPRHTGRTAVKACHPSAWEFLKADYLRASSPAFDACYRRLCEAAAANGWSPVPSLKTLRRRLDREVPRALRLLQRKSTDAAARTFPHQTRDRSVFAAMQAVNADGHTLDVFARFEDGRIARPVLVAVQDLLSGMIVGHRLDVSEHWGAVRLAFADAVESFGIPEVAYLDNGRAFASKMVSGGQPTRYRFKVKLDEPEGLLTRLGVRVAWVTPYHGQSKPIERAFRDLCEEIARHPLCEGAYTGNKPAAKPENYGARAIPIAEFEVLVARQIARHNLRCGRRTATAQGRSFAETFRASFEDKATLVKRATPAQLRELLLAAEERTARAPDGSVHLGDNRYWHEALVEQIGRKVVLRFDPLSLFLPVAVYARDGRFLCEAECIERTGFNDMAAARAHAQRKRAYLRKLRELRELELTLSIDDLARALPAPEPPPPPAPGVVKLVANGAPRARDEGWDDATVASFARGARMLDDGQVLPFTRASKAEGGAA